MNATNYISSGAACVFPNPLRKRKQMIYLYDPATFSNALSVDLLSNPVIFSSI